MTKEEIPDNQWSCNHDTLCEFQALQAMEEYAEQTAKDFFNFGLVALLDNPTLSNEEVWGLFKKEK